MKLFLIFSLLALMPFGNSAFAKKKDESAIERYYRKRPRPSTSGACKVINNSCLHAGFVKDGPASRDLKRDCRNPILKGRSVKHVFVLPGIVNSCRLQKDNEAEG
jgi:hypothetical protein